MRAFSTYGYGVEDTSYGETFDTVEALNAQVRDLPVLYNLPIGWSYFPDTGLEVTIFMPRKAKTTTFRVHPCAPGDAERLDRDALWTLVRRHLHEGRE